LEWLVLGCSKYASDTMIEAHLLVTLHEYLQRLFCVAWVIHQRTTGKSSLKEKTKQAGPFDHKKDGDSNYARAVDLHKLSTDIPAERVPQLRAVVGMIRRKVPSAEAVLYLGTEPRHSESHYLLVLVAGSETQSDQSLNNRIAESCRRIMSILSLVHHIPKTILLQQRDVFLSKATSCPALYLSSNYYLPQINKAGAQKAYIAEKDDFSPELWQRWQKQALDFLKGAEYYLTIGASEAALYALYQCTECILHAIIRAVLGFRENSHNLERLLSITRMFTGEIYALYDLENSEARGRFKLLKHSYVDVRYNDTYLPDIAVTQVMYHVTERLIQVAANIYDKHRLMKVD
jgi:HEPN domain-containing protein